MVELGRVVSSQGRVWLSEVDSGRASVECGNSEVESDGAIVECGRVR